MKKMLCCGILHVDIPYGTWKGKSLYRCTTFSLKTGQTKQVFLPYTPKSLSFQKHCKNYYVLFRMETETHGVLVDRIGSVEDPAHYYTFELYMYQLQNPSSFKSFTNHVKTLDTNLSPTDETRFIFTIDPKGSKDLDDGFSIRTTSENCSWLDIYISNVPVFLEKWNLWNHLSSRVSSIY